MSFLLSVLSVLLETLICIDFFFWRIGFLFHCFSLLYSDFQFHSFLLLSVFFPPTFFGFILLFFIWCLSRNLGYRHDTLHLFNVNIDCYKSTFQHCLSCIPYISKHFVFIFILFYVFFLEFILRLPLWPWNNWRYVFFHVFRYFPVFLPFTYFYFYPTMIENILCMISIYLNLRFIIWPRI